MFRDDDLALLARPLHAFLTVAPRGERWPAARQVGFEVTDDGDVQMFSLPDAPQLDRLRAVRSRRFEPTRSGRESSATGPTIAAMSIGRFPSIVIDCPDPASLAQFYGALFDWKVEPSADWWQVRAEYGQVIAFQKVDGYTPPNWPTQEVPQQMHLDILVDDLDLAETAVLDLGATKHQHQPGTSFRVFLDPAGHPFCLCLN